MAYQARLHSHLRILTSASLLAVAIASHEAAAQDSAPADDLAVTEIIVTAQRQAESQQDVPLSVSAFSAEQLERQRVVSVGDLQLSLPNVTFTKQNFTTASFQIRGIGTNSVGATTEDSTGIHINEMPNSGARIFETEFFDVERVEVLRGPQGTQFGRNATGGVVDVITRKPTSKFEGAGEVEYGNYNHAKIKGMLNIPLGETLAFRGAGIFLRRDGYTRNLHTGAKIDDRHQWAMRASLRYTPGENTTIDLMYQHFEENSNRSRIQKQMCHRDVTGVLGCLPDQLKFEYTNGNATIPATFTSRQGLQVLGFPAGLAGGMALYDLTVPGGDAYAGLTNPASMRTVDIDYEPIYASRETIAMATWRQSFESMELKVNGGYTHNRVFSQTDYDQAVANPINVPFLIQNPAFAGAAAPAVAQVAGRLFNNGQIGVSKLDASNTGFVGGNVLGYSSSPVEYDQSESDNVQYSVEAILTSSFSGPVNFLLGFIYFDYKQRNNPYYVAASGFDYASALVGLQQGQAAVTPFFKSDTDEYRLKSRAVFGEVYYNVNDAIKLTAGLRYTFDKKYVRARTLLLGAPSLAPYGADDADTYLTNFDADASQAGIQQYAEQRASFKRLIGRFVIDWKVTDDNLLYASYTRGYKGGGMNPPFNPLQFPNAQATFGPESINAFEIGSKNRFLDGQLQANLAAFYYDYKGLQVSRIVSRTAFNENTDARVYGLELETIWRATENWQFSANGSYLKTKIKNTSLVDPADPAAGTPNALVIKDLPQAYNCVVTTASPAISPRVAIQQAGGAFTAVGNAISNAGLQTLGGALASTAAAVTPIPGYTNTDGSTGQGAFGSCAALVASASAWAQLPANVTGGAALPFAVADGIQANLGGNQLPNSPSWKFSAAVEYSRVFTNDWMFLARLDYSWTSKQFGRIFNTGADRIKSFNIVNLKARVSAPENQWAINGFIQNLTNTDAVTGLYVTDQSTGLFRNVFTVEPRRYGMSVEFRF